MKESNFLNNGIIKCSFNFTIKVYDYRDELYFYEENNMDHIKNNWIDKSNSMIDPAYFYGLIIKKVDFDSTYSFIITYKDKLLTKDDIALGSILYTFPKVSCNNVEMFDNNRAIIFSLNDINKNIIFKLPDMYNDLNTNVNYLKKFFSHKMFLRYEVLKLQWELTSIIKNSDLVKLTRKIACEEGNLEKFLTLRLEFFK